MDKNVNRLQEFLEEGKISLRTFNALENAGITTYNQLWDLSMNDMIKIRNLHRRGVKEILSLF